MNTSETNNLLIPEVTFQTCIYLVCFFYFWKVKSLLVLNLFISEYLDIFPWKRWSKAFSVKLQIKIRLIKKFEQSELYTNKCRLFQIHLGSLSFGAIPGKFAYFYSHLSLGIARPALKLTLNCYINIKIYFSWKLII